MQARLRLHDVSVRGPTVGGATRDLTVAEVCGCSAAVAGGELELGGRLFVELRFGGEALVQFQTLTSR
jgi:hypothetical protein